ncbi:MAG TPA: M15 family metallopeptidase [Chitinophagaceae bacterium]
MKKSLLAFIALLAFTNSKSQLPNSKNPKQTPTAKKSSGPKQPTKSVVPEITWFGTITVFEVYSGLVGKSNRQINLSFTNALPTLYRNIETTDLNFTDDKGTGNVSEHVEVVLISKDEKTGVEKRIILDECDCKGEGKSELHEVVIDQKEKNYRIHAVPPPCKGSKGEDGSCGGSSWDVIISDKSLGQNPFILSGTETLVRDISTGVVTTITTWDLRGCLPWSDPQTRLRKVDPRVKAAAERFIKRAHDELCLNLKVASGLRNDKEQDSLYAIGRPPPPQETVSNARGGDSYHNYGLAIDVYIVKKDGLLDLRAILPPEAIQIAKEEGFEWGGDWTKKGKNGKVFKDYPHFEMTFGKTTKQLKASR